MLNSRKFQGLQESRGSSPPPKKKEFMKNKGIEEFQGHFYKLAGTGCPKP